LRVLEVGTSETMIVGVLGVRDGDGAESPAVVGGLDIVPGLSSIDFDAGSDDGACGVGDATTDPFVPALVLSDDSAVVWELSAPCDAGTRCSVTSTEGIVDKERGRFAYMQNA
jgi:hypothetical protein